MTIEIMVNDASFQRQEAIHRRSAVGAARGAGRGGGAAHRRGRRRKPARPRPRAGHRSRAGSDLQHRRRSRRNSLPRRGTNARATRRRSDGGRGESRRRGRNAADELVAIALAYYAFARSDTRLWREIFTLRSSNDRALPEWMAGERKHMFRHILRPLETLMPAAEPDARQLFAHTLFTATHGVIQLGLEQRLFAVPPRPSRPNWSFSYAPFAGPARTALTQRQILKAGRAIIIPQTQRHPAISSGARSAFETNIIKMAQRTNRSRSIDQDLCDEIQRLASLR